MKIPEKEWDKLKTEDKILINTSNLWNLGIYFNFIITVWALCWFLVVLSFYFLIVKYMGYFFGLLFSIAVLITMVIIGYILLKKEIEENNEKIFNKYFKIEVK